MRKRLKSPKTRLILYLLVVVGISSVISLKILREHQASFFPAIVLYTYVGLGNSLL